MIGAKRFETRSWSTDYRGPMLIQAAKRFAGLERDISCNPVFARALQAAGIVPSGGLLPTLGHLLCVVDLVDVIPTTVAVNEGIVPPGSDEQHFGNYDPGRFAWRLENVRRINPVPFKGAQGFFFVPDRLIEYREAA